MDAVDGAGGEGSGRPAKGWTPLQDRPDAPAAQHAGVLRGVGARGCCAGLAGRVGRQGCVSPGGPARTRLVGPGSVGVRALRQLCGQGLRASGEQRLFCDADSATPAEEYEVVLAAMQAQKTPIGIGSRPLRASHLLVHQPWYREQLGRGFNAAVQLLAVPGIKDTQCGFKIFSAEAAKAVFSKCRIDGFAFDSEALFIARRLGYRVAEVPISWSCRNGAVH